MWASKFTYFLFGGPNWFCFCVRADHHSVFMYGSRITWCLRAWCKWLFYGMGIDRIAFRVHGRNWLGFCLRAEITSFWYEHRTRFRFSVGRRNWLDFNVRHQNWLLLSVGIGLDLGFVRRRWTWLCLGMVAENQLGLAWPSKCWPSCAGRKLFVLDLIINFTFFLKCE